MRCPQKRKPGRTGREPPGEEASHVDGDGAVEELVDVVLVAGRRRRALALHQPADNRQRGQRPVAHLLVDELTATSRKKINDSL